MTSATKLKYIRAATADNQCSQRKHLSQWVLLRKYVVRAQLQPLYKTIRIQADKTRATQRATRRTLGLPVNGQRTRSNAKTARRHGRP